VGEGGKIERYPYSSTSKKAYAQRGEKKTRKRNRRAKKKKKRGTINLSG